MGKWTKNTLGAVSSIITGPFGSQLHSYEYVDSGIPVIMPQNISDRTFSVDKVAYVDRETADRLNRYKTQENDIVYSRRGDIEKHALITHTQAGAVCGTGCFRVRITNESIYPIFLSFFLNRPETKKWLVQQAVGSNMPNLNTEILKRVPITYPNKEEQFHIVKILDKIEQKIMLNNSINSELESTTKLLYDYWFVQFDFPNAEGKPYRASGGEMVYNEHMKREIPVGWNVKSIGDCVAKINTGLNPRKNFELGSGKNRYITIKNIEDGRINFNRCDFIDDESLQKIRNRSELSPGDILFTSIEPIGRLYRIWELPKDWDINESVFSIKTDVSRISIDYLYATMNSKHFRNLLIPLRTGSVQKGIRIGDLQSVNILIPTKEIISAFSSKVNAISKQIWSCEKQNNELSALRDFILPLLMNGQVRIENGQ